MYNEEGESVWESSLDSFGRIKEISKGSNSSCPFMYQEQYYDKEINLAYNRFRYYSPEDGRYISRDPIGLNSGEYGLYNYVGDPNGWIDVFGLAKSYSKLDKMSIEAANSITDKKTRNMTTVAVGKDKDGNLYVSTSKPYTPREVKKWAKDNNATVVNSKTPDVHAEEALHNFSGTRMEEIGSSKPICLDCENGMNKNDIDFNENNTSSKKSRKRSNNGNTGLW